MSLALMSTELEHMAVIYRALHSLWAVRCLLSVSHSTWLVMDTGRVTSDIQLERQATDEQGTEPNVCYQKWPRDQYWLAGALWDLRDQSLCFLSLSVEMTLNFTSVHDRLLVVFISVLLICPILTWLFPGPGVMPTNRNATLNIFG